MCESDPTQGTAWYEKGKRRKSTAAAQPTSLPARRRRMASRRRAFAAWRARFTAWRVGGWYQPCATRRARQRVKVSGR